MLKSLGLMTLVALSVNLVILTAPSAIASPINGAFVQAIPEIPSMAIADLLEVSEALLRGCLRSQKRRD